MTNDLTFFTNEPDAALLDRFRSTLAHVQYFDVLVGYFRTSGFHLLHEAFEDIEKIRILVGLGIDRQAFEIIDTYQNPQPSIDFESSQSTKQHFNDQVAQEMEQSGDTYETEIGVRKFIEFLQSGKLEIKAHPSQQIHAKVYISRFPEGFPYFGNVITGSSNFSFSGLQGNYEFNVELKNSADVKYSLGKFEELWAEAVDLSDAYVDTINRRTWLNDQINPYELYLKFLYEYFKEDINIDQETDIFLPPGFLELEYQKQAMVSARKILEAYNGVFLADVVGLGKTFISALLAQQLPGRKLVICPPVLKEYWRQTFFDFGIGGAMVESMGKLDRILEKDFSRFDYIFIDEAHRFRNEGTQGYEKLHQICWGKKVILVSATPLNNTIGDIFSQLKLFQAPKKSTIPGVRNLENFFRARERYIKKTADEFDKGSEEYIQAVKEVAAEVREQVLKYVMVRRTRHEISNYYADDIESQGLFFPEVADPQRVVYHFDAEIESVFTTTIERLRDFQYARYIPLLFLKKKLSAFEEQQQRNVGGFMKGIMIKRLESSFFAFKNTLGRFVKSYEQFIEMFDDGTVYIGKDVNIFDLLERDDDEEIQRLLNEDKLRQFPAADFEPIYRKMLQADLIMLREILALWAPVTADPKLDQFVQELKRNPLLKRKQVIIFTESSETGAYLSEQLELQFPGKVLSYNSGGGRHVGKSISKPVARKMIEQNYDPGQETRKKDIRILISTDVLAEGVNLHRANIVINYDLPWNPTRVLQRVGRVNRVGTKHPDIYIFNFFPTSQSDEHLGLEDNITAKLQAFHDTLGEDAKYLSEEEDVAQHELFGDRLFNTLSRKETYIGEEEGQSELEFLQIMRHIRDNDPQLFEKIKCLPKKARAGRTAYWDLAELPPKVLVSFFRRGRLKKFYLAGTPEPAELTFLDAVAWLRCEPDTPRQDIPKAYYEMLERNKQVFAEATSSEDDDLVSGSGRSHVNWLIKYIKVIRKAPQLTDDQEIFLRDVLGAFERGVVPKNITQRLRRALSKVSDPLKGVGIFRSNIPTNLLQPQLSDPLQDAPIEVILSAYLQHQPDSQPGE
jgi:superfamily II DNA or RNA helicase/HKD family nuclease